MTPASFFFCFSSSQSLVLFQLPTSRQVHPHAQFSIFLYCCVFFSPSGRTSSPPRAFRGKPHLCVVALVSDNQIHGASSFHFSTFQPHFSREGPVASPSPGASEPPEAAKQTSQWENSPTEGTSQCNKPKQQRCHSTSSSAAKCRSGAGCHCKPGEVPEQHGSFLHTSGAKLGPRSTRNTVCASFRLVSFPQHIQNLQTI